MINDLNVSYYLNNNYREEEVNIDELYNDKLLLDVGGSKVIKSELDLRLLLSHLDLLDLYSVILNKIDKYELLNQKRSVLFFNYYLKKKELIKIRPYYNSLLVMFNIKPKLVNKLESDLLENINILDKEYKDKFNNNLIYIILNQDNVNLFDSLFELLINQYKLNKKKNLKYINKEKNDLDLISKYNLNSQERLNILGFNDYLEKSTSVNCPLSDNLTFYGTVLVRRKKNIERKNQTTITVGELSAGFRGNYEINLDLLKECDMADKNSKSLYVKSLGECRFSMNVWADDFDDKAIKMILLTKGNVYKYI